MPAANDPATTPVVVNPAAPRTAGAATTAHAPAPMVARVGPYLPIMVSVIE